MVTPTIDYDPSNPEWRKQVIAASSDEQLEALFNDVQGRMYSLIHAPRPQGVPASKEIFIWKEFLEEIEAERRKRGPNVQSR
jgi:hypothetical protein